MIDPKKFRNWLQEKKKKEPPKNKSFYVLVGPPAVGKTSWIKNFIEDSGKTYMVISRDQIIEDQIFPKYELSNNELYTINPPPDAEEGKIVSGMEKFGKVIKDHKGRNSFLNVLRANKEIEELIKKETRMAVSYEPELIVIDAINGTEKERDIALRIMKDKKDYKKIAIYFEFKPYRKEIEKRAAERAKKMSKEFGDKFDRNVPSKVYDAIFNRITVPSESEGFDEVKYYDSFKGGIEKDRMDITAETLVRGFRDFLENIKEEEKEKLEEARLSKVFRREAKQKAKRREEKYGYKHRKWAENRQTQWNAEHPELEELYLKEIENATAAAQAARDYLQKRREIRRKKLEEKEKAKFKKPTGKKRKTLPSPYAGEGPETKNFPYKKGRTGGVAKVYQTRIKRISGAGAAPGETIGPGLGAGMISEANQLNLATWGDLQDLLTDVANNKKTAFLKRIGKTLAVDTLLDVGSAAAGAKAGAAIGSVGGLPGAAVGAAAGFFTSAGAKFLYAYFKNISQNNKRTNTFIDKLKIDPEYLKILADDVEVSFFNFIKNEIFRKPPTEALPINYSMNKELKQWLRANYKQRTLTGAF